MGPPGPDDEGRFGSRLAEIFALALDTPSEERESVVARHAGDAELEARVLKLLGAHADDSGPLDIPFSVLAASLFVDDDADDEGQGGDPPSREIATMIPPGSRIGPYRVIRSIGQGGMGLVYLGERADGAFEQRIALKLLGVGGNDDATRRRFLAERRIVARLRHPNIAHLLDGGVTPDGRHWFAMEYVEGVSLTDYADDRCLDVDARLGLFLQVCEAVSHAHRQHVIHRDLKPSNILVTVDDGEAAQVKLLDFGIAKLVEPGSADPSLTRQGMRPLTPEYAVPEQLLGHAITPAADVYALGLILYELLSGRRVYECNWSSTAEIARVVCEQKPLRPSAAVHRLGPGSRNREPDPTPADIARARSTSLHGLRRSLHGDLDAVCLEALEKNPSRRYPSVDALAEDIRRYRSGRPLNVRRPTVGYRTLRLATRHRAGIAIALGGVAVATVAATLLPMGVLRRAPMVPSLATGAGGFGHPAGAIQLHDEGLRAMRSDLYAAQRFFRAALDVDSTYAPAAYYALLLESHLEMPRDTALETRLRRLADDLPEKERMLMQARWSTFDPALVGLAGALVNRYPDEPEGHLLLGRALVARGELARARISLREAIVRDSSGLGGMAAHCPGCEAYRAIVSAYIADDSLAAAERVSREWLARQQPGSLQAWFSLAGVLEYQGRLAEALEAMRGTSPRQQATPYLPIYPAILAIRDGDFGAADRLLGEQLRAGPPDVQRQAAWFLVISLRYQGRLRDALAVAQSLQRLGGGGGSLAEAQVLLEMERGREAEVLFASLATERVNGGSSTSSAGEAHRRSFALTHVATARVAAGDTAGLMALADTIEELGAQTLMEQRRRIHHHVRGLLLVERGEMEAATGEFRAAMAWPNHDHTRTNVELARALLALGRPSEAIPFLESAFHGPLETARFWATHTQLHELLGQAYEEAGDPERAVEHYDWVRRALKSADPLFDTRRAAVARRLEALGRGSDIVPPNSAH